MARYSVCLAVALAPRVNPATFLQATNEVSYGLPIMVTLISAKFFGDYFTAGIYDTHIHLKKVPLLEWEAEDEMKRYTSHDVSLPGKTPMVAMWDVAPKILCAHAPGPADASYNSTSHRITGQVMSTDLKCIKPVSNVAEIVELLRNTTHHAFPVVRTRGTLFEGQGVWGGEVPVGGGKFVGLILRNQLITMLQYHCWGVRKGHTTNQPTLSQCVSQRQLPFPLLQAEPDAVYQLPFAGRQFPKGTPLAGRCCASSRPVTVGAAPVPGFFPPQRAHMRGGS